MSILGFILLLALQGLVIGGLARLALPGKDPMSVPMTIGIGIAGSFIGGLIGAAIFGRGGGSFVIAVLVATGLVYLVRRRRGGQVLERRPLR